MMKSRLVVGMVVTVIGLAAGCGTAALLSGGGSTHTTAERQPLGSVTVVAPTATTAPKPATPEGAKAVAGDTFATDPGTLPGGLLAYARTDGTWVAVDPTAPVPAAVQADLAVAATRALAGAAADRGAAAVALETLDSAALQGTGRGAVVVFEAQDQSPDEQQAGTCWVFWGKDGDASERSARHSLEQAQSDAQAWIAKHGTESFTMVVAQ